MGTTRRGSRWTDWAVAASQTSTFEPTRDTGSILEPGIGRTRPPTAGITAIVGLVSALATTRKSAVTGAPKPSRKGELESFPTQTPTHERGQGQVACLLGLRDFSMTVAAVPVAELDSNHTCDPFSCLASPEAGEVCADR